jgi:hypothetical protein
VSFDWKDVESFSSKVPYSEQSIDGVESLCWMLFCSILRPVSVVASIPAKMLRAFLLAVPG